MEMTDLTSKLDGPDPTLEWGNGFRSDGDATKWYRASVYEQKARGGLGIRSQSLYSMSCFSILNIHRIGLGMLAMNERINKVKAKSSDARVEALEAEVADLRSSLSDALARLDEIANSDIIASAIKRTAKKVASKKKEK